MAPSHLLASEHGGTQMKTVLLAANPEGGLLFPVNQKSFLMTARSHVLQGAFPRHKGKGKGSSPLFRLLPYGAAVVSNGGDSNIHGRLKSLPNSPGVNFTMVGRPWGQTKGLDVWKRSSISSFICRIFRGSPLLMAPRQAA